jgi:hypothetical protein
LDANLPAPRSDPRFRRLRAAAPLLAWTPASRHTEEKMRPDRTLHGLVAAVFGLGFLGLAVAGFIQDDTAQRQIEAKLERIRSGAIQPDTLVVRRKYVNPGRSGLAHIVLGSASRPDGDIVATRDFFNSVNLGQAVRAYAFADGYLVPESLPGISGAGKWFFLGLGVLMGGISLALAWRMMQRARR